MLFYVRKQRNNLIAIKLQLIFVAYWEFLLHPGVSLKYFFKMSYNDNSLNVLIKVLALQKNVILPLSSHYVLLKFNTW